MARSRLTTQELANGAEGIALVCDDCGCPAVAVYHLAFSTAPAFAICEEHEQDLDDAYVRVLDIAD